LAAPIIERFTSHTLRVVIKHGHKSFAWPRIFWKGANIIDSISRHAFLLALVQRCESVFVAFATTISELFAIGGFLVEIPPTKGPLAQPNISL